MICSLSRMKNIQDSLNTSWYQAPPWWMYALLPLAVLFAGIVKFRRWLYQKNLKQVITLKVPVIIVGNITVGGTGKTPLVIYLAELLSQQGYHPGIISRGYGGDNKVCHSVTGQSDPAIVGDEAVLIAKRTGCPVVIGRKRVAAAKQLLAMRDCDVLISDDGLQHYALARDIEIAVIDAERRFGNGWLLPFGPLRESKQRLTEVDFIVTNGENKTGEFANEFNLQLHSEMLYQLDKPQQSSSLTDWRDKTVHAIAGIGHPQRFFNRLIAAGLQIFPHTFADHYAYREKDIAFADAFAVIMTEKDAIKCQQFVNEKLWCLPVDARLSSQFDAALLQRLEEVKMKKSKRV